MDNFDNNEFNNDFNNYERQPNHEMNSRYGRGRTINEHHRRSKFDDTEFAADFLANDYSSGDSTTAGLIVGVAGLVAAVVALFTYPIVLGIVGIALGIYAVAKGNKVIGYLTIGIGLLAAVIPLFYTGPFITIF